MFSFILGIIWKTFTWTVETIASCAIEALLF
jgi:hypothetical protein